MIPAHPVLSCQAATDFETNLLGQNEEAIQKAMQAAGEAAGLAVLRDFNELHVLPRDPRVLILVGKGHNGGDTLLAAETIIKTRPRAQIDLVLAFPESELKPLVTQALNSLESNYSIRRVEMERIDEYLSAHTVDICIDGILGMAFRPPLKEPLLSLVNAVNQAKRINFRASIDLPTGIGDSSSDTAFRADFTYLTGIAKEPAFQNGNRSAAGRIRYLDIGFFEDTCPAAGLSMLTPHAIDPLRSLRPSDTHKRNFGHLLIMGGSRMMPGALTMCVLAALRSGVGLVTVFAPKSIVPSMAAQVPEAMWVPWEESEDGCLMQQGMSPLFDKMEDATALLIGPGMGRPMETQGMIVDTIRGADSLPIILDADALQPDIVRTVRDVKNRDQPILMTPHFGEIRRMLGDTSITHSPETIRAFCKDNGCYSILKGSITYISDGDQVSCSTFGGPVLARGGSGDLLSGLIGGIMAQSEFSKNPYHVLQMGTVWHGLAADHLARAYGHRAVRVTDLLHYLGNVLRSVW